jgi:single-strand selective monofunctional uracil DNA glycosylase
MSAASLILSAQKLSKALQNLSFASPIHTVYNPLEYAWEAHQTYLKRYANSPKKVLFLGMNPGPFGMAQTGIPFGEIPAVRDWLKIQTQIGQPHNLHPKRPISGFACAQSEVSGRRLWGLFAQRYPNATEFFLEHFVANYCPLVFMSESGRNITPDQLQPQERINIENHCDLYLQEMILSLKPDWLIGVGAYAEKQMIKAKEQLRDRLILKTGKILHPSPASPAANKDWAGTATRQLIVLSVWNT